MLWGSNFSPSFWILKVNLKMPLLSSIASSTKNFRFTLSAKTELMPDLWLVPHWL